MAYPDLAAGDLVYRSNVDAGISGPITGANKLWLSVWSGEVMHAYDAYNMFESLVESRTISSGVSMEFPLTGTVNLKPAWAAGEELTGGSNSVSTTIAIKLDKRPIAAHFEMDNVDLMQTQWEFRSELARQAGLTLANTRDKQIAAYIARAGMEDFNWSGTNDAGSYSLTDPRGVPTGPVFIAPEFEFLGNQISVGTSDERTNAALKALQAVEDFLVYLQTINAPTEGVYLAVTPRAFQDIRALGVARTDAANPNYLQPMFGGVAQAGGLGAQLSQGLNGLMDSLDYMGAKIIKSNHLPVSNYTAGAVGEARYNLSYGNAGIVGVVFQRGAVAALKLQGLKVDTVDDIRRNTTFTVASSMNGTGVLRPECAAVLVGPTATNTDTDTAWDQADNKLFTSAGAVFAQVDGAGSGGSEAAMARAMLREIAGLTREYVETAANDFPYA